MIKRITLLVAVALMAVSAVNAQVEKGKILLGGKTDLSFVSSTITPKYDGTAGDKIKTSSFEFAPEIGYFVMDGLAIGLDLSYSSQKSKVGDDDWSDPQTMMIVGAFGKYYMGSGKFKPFGKAEVGFVSIADSKDDEDKMKGLGLQFQLGGAYFVSESIALEFGLAYQFAKLKNKAEDKLTANSSDFGFNVGIAVTF